MTGSPLEVVAVFAAAGLLLAAVIWADNAWLAHHRPQRPEPPSRLDHLDGLDTPVERHHTDLPPVGGSAGRSTGDPWTP